MRASRSDDLLSAAALFLAGKPKRGALKEEGWL
jgi:hypothetical protein